MRNNMHIMTAIAVKNAGDILLIQREYTQRTIDLIAVNLINCHFESIFVFRWNAKW